MTRPQLLYATRSFVGIHRVRADATAQLHFLDHGTALHGLQSQTPALRHEPLRYYYRSGPVGQFFAVWNETCPTGRVAVSGLGAGSLSAYALPGQRWAFYEIDPAVLQIARQPR